MNTLRIVASAKGCDLADGLLKGSEAGLLHLTAISNVVGRKIRVWDTAGEVLGIFGIQQTKDREPGFIEEIIGITQDKFNRPSSNANKNIRNSYLELQYQSFDNGRIGHWVTKDCDDLPKRENRFLKRGNNCLFVAICQQCQGYEPEMLRILTADVIRRKAFVIEDVFPQFQGASILLLGGAKYDGRNSDHAKQILDESQGTVGYGHAAKAHPRGHASHPSATGNIDCVENYSRDATQDFPKSAWMSRDEQDNSLHRLLLSRQVQDGIDGLNNGATRIIIKMDPGFEIQVGLWAGGEMFRGPLRAEFVTILLQHHNGRQNNHSADVQVFTCYPMAPKGSENISTNIPRNLPLKRSLSPPEDDNEETNKKFKLNFS